MTPDEVIEQLEKVGVEISRPTLTRYEKQGLIPIPDRGGLGRGGGRWTNYPRTTVYEAYAAWKLMHGDYGDEQIKIIWGGKMPNVTPESIIVIRFIRDFFEKYETENLPVEAVIDYLNIFILEQPPEKTKFIKGTLDIKGWSFIMGFYHMWSEQIAIARKRMLK